MVELLISAAYGYGWMVLNTYFESQGESLEGKIAVNQVVMQRMVDRNMSAEQVIRERFQFSWLWDDVRDIIKDTDAFLECFVAIEIAKKRRELGDNFGHANLYHAASMKKYPPWASSPKVKKIAQIDGHIFYHEPWKTSNNWTLAKNE